MKIVSMLLVAACVFFVSAWLFFCGGCAKTIKNIPAIAATGTTAYTGYDLVAGVIATNRGMFSSEEITQLRTAGLRMVAVRNQLATIRGAKSAAELAMDLPAMVPLYNEVKSAYLVAQNIVLGHIAEFSENDQIILYSYQGTCQRLDASIHDAMTDDKGKDHSQVVSDIFSFVILIGKIAIPLLLL